MLLLVGALTAEADGFEAPNGVPQLHHLDVGREVDEINEGVVIVQKDDIGPGQALDEGQLLGGSLHRFNIGGKIKLHVEGLGKAPLANAVVHELRVAADFGAGNAGEQDGFPAIGIAQDGAAVMLVKSLVDAGYRALDRLLHAQSPATFLVPLFAALQPQKFTTHKTATRKAQKHGMGILVPCSRACR